MIKKALLTTGLIFLAGFIFFGMWTGTIIPAWPAEKSRSQYIENSFKSFEDKFFEEAKFNFIPGIIMSSFLADETEPKTTSYYLTVYGAPNSIGLISAKKEIKLNDHLVEIYEEIIYPSEVGKPFEYIIKHTIMDQNNDCEEKDLEPIEIWDEVIEKLIFNKEDRVQYIKDGFDSFGEYFFVIAKRTREGDDVHYCFKKETDPRTTSYYLTVTTNAYIPMYIISINARKEIEMGDGLVEWYAEGISLVEDTNKYSHNISHVLMNRSENCEETKLYTAKVWDDVIANLFQ